MQGGDLQPPSLEEIRAALTRVSHDINNPLSIISGNAQLLLELANSLDLDEEFAQPVRDIEEASLRASGMLRSLTDLAQRLRAPSAEQTPPGSGGGD